jgi:hypothetical protein
VVRLAAAVGIAPPLPLAWRWVWSCAPLFLQPVIACLYHLPFYILRVSVAYLIWGEDSDGPPASAQGAQDG